MDLDSFVKVENVDPVADFLAREQNILADIEGDLEFNEDLTHLSQEIHDDNGCEMVNDENIDIANLNGNSDDYNPFSQTNELPTFIKMENTESTNFKVNGLVVDDEPAPEHEKITRWRTESVKMLNEKDEEEAKKKQELSDQAKQELQDWYSQYNDQLNRLKASNREAEAEWVAERDTAIPGKEWEKVTRMIDFNPKPNQKNIKDTSRMKSILLQLKQNPPKESTPSA